MKTNELPLADAADGSEEVIVNQGAGSAAETKRMPAALLAAAGTRPTPDELKAAVLAALIAGANITFTDNGDGTTSVRISDNADLPGVPKADTAAPGTNTRQIATTAFVKAAVDALATIVNGKQGELIEGTGVHITDNGDGTFTIAATGGGGGGGLVDGTYGDVVVSGGGTVLSVKSATNATITVPTEVYGPAWSGKMSVPTKDALYNKIETVAASISARVAASAVGAVNGVASLDATGKVPAGQLPSYVDDVLEFGSNAGFPNPGETGKIYVALDTNFQWRWSGTAYVQIAASPGTTDNVPEGPTNKYYTDVRVRAAVMTGLADTVGTPAATDSLLTLLGKLKRQAFTVLGPIATGIFSAGFIYANTDKAFFGHDGTNGFVRSQVGTLWLGGNGASVLALSDTNVISYGLFESISTSGLFGVSHSRTSTPGQVGYHLYNGGATCEWLVYQPAHATADDYRIGTLIAGAVSDKFKIAPDGTITIYGSFTSPGNVSGKDFNASRGDGTGVIYLGAPGGTHYLYWDATNYNLPAGGLIVGGNISASSDARLKSNIRPFADAVDIARRLRAYRFTMDEKESVGVIAQEVAEVLPELVSTDDKGMLAVDYGKLTAVLIADNNAMAARLEALEAMVAKLAA